MARLSNPGTLVWHDLVWAFVGTSVVEEIAWQTKGVIWPPCGAKRVSYRFDCWKWGVFWKRLLPGVEHR